MALKTKKAKKVLKKEDQRHLSYAGIHTMSAMQRQVDFMKEKRERDPSPIAICWECWSIAKKLEMI